MTSPEQDTPNLIRRRGQVVNSLQRVVGRVLPFIDPVVERGLAKYPEPPGFARRFVHESGRVAIKPMRNIVFIGSAESVRDGIAQQVVSDAIASWPPLESPSPDAAPKMSDASEPQE